MADKDTMETAELLRQRYAEMVARIKREFEWPHRLTLVCTGRGKHQETHLSEVWVDKATGGYSVNQTTPSRNMHNVVNNQKPDHVVPYVLGKTPEQYIEEGSADTLRGLEEIGSVPSWTADRIRCHRCKLDEQRNVAMLSLIYLESAWANMSTVNVDYLPELIPMVKKAVEEREERKEARGNSRGDRPRRAGHKSAWQEYACSKGLNIDGMDKNQIIRTVLYYGL